MKAIHLALVLAAVVPVTAQTPPVGPPGNPNRPGPWDNDVLVFRLPAGGQPEKLATFERAGVPAVARMRDGRLIAAFQSFPHDDRRNFDRVAVRFSSDEGRTWTTPQPIVVEGMEAGLARPFDPTLVTLPDGRLRLYFTSNRSPDFRRSTPQIYSAISTNGVDYKFEPGVRFGIEGRVVIDCAVALHEGVFHLIVPDNGAAEDFVGQPQRGQQPMGGSGYHAISEDGLSFKRVADVKLSSTRDRWLGNLQHDGGKLLFFGTGPGRWPVTSQNGVTWEADAAATRLPGADPAAVKLRDGSWLVLVTGEPRPGTPSALQRSNSRIQPPGGPLPRENPHSQLDDAPESPLLAAPDRQRGAANPSPQSEGLRSHHVHSATSADGLNWTRDEGVRVTSVSVPCAINDGDRRVLLYFVKPPSQPGEPETVACAVSTDGMHFKTSPEFRIEGLSAIKAVDPSILKDGEGKFRLYYLASNHSGDPARGENPHKINFALSEDGIRFREAGTAFSYDNLVDPDVFRFQDRWFMYVFAGRGTVIATSTDGKDFRFLREMIPRDWGTTAPVPLPDGRLRLYAFEQRVPIGNAVRSFLSTNGVDWVVEPGLRVQAAANEQITDPFVIPWRGTWKMYFKTSPARTPGVATPQNPNPLPKATAPQNSAIPGDSQIPWNGRPQGRTFGFREAGSMAQFETSFIRIPSSAAGEEGVAASLLLPGEPRFTNGAPIVINVSGGVQAGNARGRPEYVRHGFLEIHFAFPGGGAGEERSGGTYDFRGPNCIRALADVIRFATGRTTDKRGRFIGELTSGLKVLTNNAGLVGSSHGGNACGLAMAKFGGEFPDLAWYASMESPYGEGAANVELGGHESGMNPAYDPKSGLLDLSKLVWSEEISPGLFRKPMLVSTRDLKGAFFFDLNGDGRFSRSDDFPANCFVGDAGDGVKAWYSPRILEEAETRGLLPGSRPAHVPTLAETRSFWVWRDAAPSIPDAVRHCTNLAVIIYANERDHVQADPAHTHILVQEEAFRKAAVKFIRLNPDRAYVEHVTATLPPSRRTGVTFPDNPAGKIWTRATISEGVEPSELPLGLYMQAATCELADRTQFRIWTSNLDGVLVPFERRGTALPESRSRRATNL